MLLILLEDNFLPGRMQRAALPTLYSDSWILQMIKKYNKIKYISWFDASAIVFSNVFFLHPLSYFLPNFEGASADDFAEVWQEPWTILILQMVQKLPKGKVSRYQMLKYVYTRSQKNYDAFK